MKINRTLEIAIDMVTTLKQLNMVGLGANSETLAVGANTTNNFAEQILRDLRIANLILVKRGPGGGYSINPDKSNTLTAYDVAVAIGHKFDSTTTKVSSLKLRDSIKDVFKQTLI